MNGKKGNIGVENINLKKPNHFLFLNFFFVFISLRVRSSRQFFRFFRYFLYKYEKYKYRYIKYEQHSFSLIFLKYNTNPPKSETPKNPEASRNSKKKKSTAEVLFWYNSAFYRVYMLLYTKTSFLTVVSIQMVDNVLKRKH